MPYLMVVVRAIVATVLATTLAIGIVLAELDEAAYRGVLQYAVDSSATSQDVIDALDILAESTGPLNFDSTFLLLTAAIIVLVVPDAIAYFRRKHNPSPASEENEDDKVDTRG